jgi:hypothetical protein
MSHPRDGNLPDQSSVVGEMLRRVIKIKPLMARSIRGSFGKIKELITVSYINIH